MLSPKRHFFVALFSLSLTTGCASQLGQAFAPEHPTATAAELPANVAAPQLRPAPADYSRADAKRYYQAQVELLRSSVPQKQKNSNNVTTELTQTVQNGITTPQLLLSWSIAFAVGALCVIGTQKLLRYARAGIVVSLVLLLAAGCGKRPYAPGQYRFSRHEPPTKPLTYPGPPLPNSASYARHSYRR